MTSTTKSPDNQQTPIEQSRLFEVLLESFDAGQFAGLCSGLAKELKDQGKDAGELERFCAGLVPGEAVSPDEEDEKKHILALIDYCQREQCIPEFLVQCTEEQEDGPWHRFIEIDEQDLLEEIRSAFNLPELRDLVFNIGIDIGDLDATETKRSISRELINYCQRHGCSHNLVAACKSLGKGRDWEAHYRLNPSGTTAKGQVVPDGTDSQRRLLVILAALIVILLVAGLAIAWAMGLFTPNEPPVAQFEARFESESHKAPEAITFDASGSTDDGSIAAYDWSFGDGSNGSGQVITHTYQEAEVYEVELTVVDDEGAIHTENDFVQVLPKNQLPSAEFTSSLASNTARAPASFDFDASNSFDEDGSIKDYKWDFGDGNTGSGPSVRHEYAEAGTFLLILTVTDDEDESQVKEERIVVEAANEAPMASFLYTSESSITRAPVSFEFDAAGSSDDYDSIREYLWDFGDDSEPSSGLSVSHEFTEAGEFLVTLKVIDDEGLSYTFEDVVEVLPANQAPDARFVFEPETSTAPGEITFDASGSSDDYEAIAEYRWDFGDDTPGDTGATVDHTYEVAGDYAVQLTVTDDGGKRDTEEQTVTILPPLSPPTGSFTFEPVRGRAPITITFDASGSVDADGSIAEYSWEFGDGEADSGSRVSHTYEDPGDYDVQLQVTDDNGESGVLIQTITVLPSHESSPADRRLNSWPNLREGPGEAYCIIEALERDTRVTVVHRTADDTWYEIQLIDDDFSGWVGSTTEFAPSLNPEDVDVYEPPEAAMVNYQILVPCKAYLRTTPGIDSPWIAVLPKRSYLEILARTEDLCWFFVEYEGGTGWIGSSVSVVLYPQDPREIIVDTTASKVSKCLLPG